MTENEYLLGVVERYSVGRDRADGAVRAARGLMTVLEGWAGYTLREVSFSGSYAKGTGVKGSTDIDLFVSLSSETPGTLQELYVNLHGYLNKKGYRASPRNVAIGVLTEEISIDVVPGRKIAGAGNDHAIYQSRRETWMKTNISTHIRAVRESGRIDEIRLVKVWRNIQGLHFPSFYLELSVLKALEGQGSDSLAGNMLRCLEYFKDDFSEARMVDPANSNNLVSDDLTEEEKRAIRDAAESSILLGYWEKIFR